MWQARGMEHYYSEGWCSNLILMILIRSNQNIYRFTTSFDDQRYGCNVVWIQHRRYLGLSILAIEIFYGGCVLANNKASVLDWILTVSTVMRVQKIKLEKQMILAKKKNAISSRNSQDTTQKIRYQTRWIEVSPKESPSWANPTLRFLSGMFCNHSQSNKLALHYHHPSSRIPSTKM